MKTETSPEFFIRIKAQVKRIQEASVNKPEPDAADFQLVLQRKGVQPVEPLDRKSVV